MFQNIVTTVSTWVAAIVIIVFLVFIVKDIIEFVKGQGSAFKIIGHIVGVFFFVGVIIAAQNYESFGEAFSNVAEDAIENVGEEAGNLFE